MARIRKKKLTPRIPRAELNRRAAAQAESTEKLSAQAQVGPKYSIMDRSKPFGIISPIVEGASYAQKCSDGITRYYDGTFRRVKTTWDVAEPSAAAKQPAKAKQAEASKPKQAAQPVVQPAPQPAEADDDDEDTPADEKPPTITDGEVNLTAWAEDPDTNYPFAEVRRAVMDTYSKVVTTERDALAFLIDEKVADPVAADAKWGA